MQPFQPIPVSTVPAVRAYLFTQLDAALSGQDVKVYYDVPGPGFPDDFIWLGTTEQTQEPARMVGSGGAGWIDETYHQLIEVSVFRGGDESQVVFERACALVAQVEAVIRADPSLGGLVVAAHPAGTTYESDWEASHMGRITEAQMRIQIQATPI